MKTDMALWQALNAYDIDAADAVLPFSRRLARDNDWSYAHAQATVEEYKRFIYLICISGTVLTPSEDVDQAWHLHLIYTRDYWDRFCDRTLGRKIHHSPTEGGVAEDAKYFDAYRRTLDLYEAEFGTPPPVAIWPSPRQRFETNSRTSHVIRLPKRQVFLCLASASALMLAGCATQAIAATDTVLAWAGFAVMAVILMALNLKNLKIGGLAGFFIVGVPLVGFLTWMYGDFAHDMTKGLLPMDYSRALMATVFLGIWMLMYLAPNTGGRRSGSGGGCGGSSGCSSGCGSSGCGGGCGGD
ncbi:hypothetical protein ABAC460_12615 [Asticcacaulis sp. AC460]|uniref:glycine-rich domain-containing protein n=1 Tax=Asticcacaulis sp. AC460 TaxID=1282360 RepID=UPI0003C3D13D|nr:hypothetical protein [Asticcacaulis sp. AC460]ESQ89703.1 hypothetical protein ABAC460_12615 [Asticcacaulis sp. AC460]